MVRGGQEYFSLRRISQDPAPGRRTQALSRRVAAVAVMARSVKALIIEREHTTNSDYRKSFASELTA
jgi:hypothetical protein